MLPGNAIDVHEHLDDAEEHSIAVFTSRIGGGVVAATVGVMDVDQRRGGSGPPVATEIIVDSRTDRPYVAGLAATLGFFIIKNGWKAAPGVTFARMLPMYAPELRVKHVLFVPPFQWEQGMTRVTLSDRTLLPLLAVPISDDELTLVESQGAKELETRWSRERTDVFDWDREGAVR
jgi:hypothetical protein